MYTAACRPRCWRLRRLPRYQATSTAPSFTNSAGLNATTAAATLTVEDPTGITVAGGSPQNTVIGTPFGTLLQALVDDASGNPIAGIPVTFAAPTNGPTGSFNALATVLSDGRGIATAPTLTANHIAGTFMVTAIAEGVASPADFTLMNTTVPASIKAVAGTAQHATVDTPYKIPQQARNYRSPRQAGCGHQRRVRVAERRSGTFAGASAVVTNANGVATAPVLTANTEAGTFTISAGSPASRARPRSA